MRKGFTLVELLAVIVILAIIALITTPIILLVMERIRIEVAVNSARGYIRAVNYKLASDLSKDQDNYIEKQSINIDINPIKVNLNGQGPTGRLVEISKNNVSYAELCVNNYSILYENGKAEHDKNNDYCNSFKEPAGTIINEVCKDESLYNSSEVFKIKKVEDLVCLSELVNEGKDFSNKEVLLLSDIDFKDSNSYNNSNKLEELTTNEGFKPIGNDKKPFRGTFEGYGFTISNLYVNSTTDYAGLFGYNTGIIQGLNLVDINIKSTGNYVGGLAGYNTKTIKDVNVKGDVTSTDSYVGGIVGRQTDAGVFKSALVNVNVSGKGAVGGLIGNSASSGRNEGIVEGGKITGTGSSVSVDVGMTNSGSVLSYINETVTLNEQSYTGTNKYVGGPDVNGYERILDTWIGGDNNDNGYYFDYNDDGTDVIVKSEKRYPMKFNLEGEGTKENPYKINNYSDWKTATLNVKEIDAYYELTSDIDFSKDKFYMLGSVQNYFSGFIDGNGYELKNIKMNGAGYLGVSGYNAGTIRGLSVINEKIEAGSEYVGGIVGYNVETVEGINISTNITSKSSYVGGLAGYNTKTIKDVNVKGDVTSTDSYVGGIVGRQTDAGVFKSALVNVNVSGKGAVGGLIGNSASSGRNEGIVEGGKITGTGSSVSVDVGMTNSGSVLSYINETVTLNEQSYTGTNKYQSQYYNDLDYYSTFNILDITDGDGNGYYFDYNYNDTDIIIVKISKSTSTSPDTPPSSDNSERIKTIIPDSNAKDTTPPECTLLRFSNYGNDGFSASYACTDNVEVADKRHIYWATDGKNNIDYEEFLKLPSNRTPNSTVNSKWTITSSQLTNIDPPVSGLCYYFYYGASDTSGNTSVYVSKECKSF